MGGNITEGQVSSSIAFPSSLPRHMMTVTVLEKNATLRARRQSSQVSWHPGHR